jgi:hypothetical protein
MSNAGFREEEWMRLPRPKARCPITGLSRTSLVEIIDEKDPVTHEPYVKQMRKERHGKQRRIRMINRASLLEYLDKRASAQALQFAPHVNNPNVESVESVITDFELFGYFVGVDNKISDEEWFEGKLSTRKARIQLLRNQGLIVDAK